MLGVEIALEVGKSMHWVTGGRKSARILPLAKRRHRTLEGWIAAFRKMEEPIPKQPRVGPLVRHH